jgi:glycosyltransferase involved in cell wall biosynthesis
MHYSVLRLHRSRMIPEVAATAAAASRERAVAPSSQVVVVIPAYKPEPILTEIVSELAEAPAVAGILVVNDGSGPEYEPIFSAAAEVPAVTVLRHAVNLGKGAALKTGMNYAACHFGDRAGIVTADADGQHAVSDILNTADSLAAYPSDLVLGTRGFAGEVPLRSRIGNTLTRGVVRAVTGESIADTQTGLRGIPMGFVPELLRSKAGGYEFELEMLVACRQSGRPIRQVPISTIYIEGNRSSHFNPLLDSMRIYFVFLRFSAVSLLTAGLDNLVFVAAFWTWSDILAAMCCGRIVAGMFNYFANKFGTFRVNVRDKIALPKFVLSVVLAGTASYALITWLVDSLGFGVVRAKFVAETAMFFISFWIQREFVFRVRGRTQS